MQHIDPRLAKPLPYEELHMSNNSARTRPLGVSMTRAIAIAHECAGWKHSVHTPTGWSVPGPPEPDSDPRGVSPTIQIHAAAGADQSHLATSRDAHTGCALTKVLFRPPRGPPDGRAVYELSTSSACADCNVQKHTELELDSQAILACELQASWFWGSLACKCVLRSASGGADVLCS